MHASAHTQAANFSALNVVEVEAAGLTWIGLVGIPNLSFHLATRILVFAPSWSRDLRNETHEGFAAIHRRLDQIIQTRLDEHATRIKELETAVFSK